MLSVFLNHLYTDSCILGNKSLFHVCWFCFFLKLSRQAVNDVHIWTTEPNYSVPGKIWQYVGIWEAEVRVFVCKVRWHGKAVLQSSLSRFFLHVNSTVKARINASLSISSLLGHSYLEKVEGLLLSLDTFMTPSFSSFSACLSLTHGGTAVPSLMPLTVSPSSLFHKLHLQDATKLHHSCCPAAEDEMML